MGKSIIGFLIFLLLCTSPSWARMNVAMMGGGGVVSTCVTPSGAQDFTTYTHVGTGYITVESSSVISWLNYPRSATEYVYKDFGVAAFCGDLNNRFVVQRTNNDSSALTTLWMLANALGNINTIATGDYVSVQRYGTSIRLAIVENAVFRSDAYTDATNTVYYVTVTRDHEGGANGTGQVNAYIRTGSHTGTLVDTLTLDSSAGEQNTYRYLYAANTLGSGTNLASGSVSTMELEP